MSKIRVLAIAALATLGVLLTSATAFATDVSLFGHGTPGTSAQGEAAGGIVESSGALPFTGLNLALIVVGGAALLAAGLVLRRRSSAAQR